MDAEARLAWILLCIPGCLWTWDDALAFASEMTGLQAGPPYLTLFTALLRHRTTSTHSRIFLFLLTLGSSFCVVSFGHILYRSSLLSGMTGGFTCVCSLSLTKSLSGFLRIPNLVSLISWAPGSDRKMLLATLLCLTMVAWVVPNLLALLFIEVRQGLPLPRCVFQKIFNNSSRNSEHVKGWRKVDINFLVALHGW